MSRDIDVVDALRHYRHDWLNQIQLIKGNLALGRLDKVDSIIDDLVQQSKNESQLSNMNIPKVATSLLTCNWEEHPYIVSFETLTGEQGWSSYEDEIFRLINDIFNIFDEQSNRGEDNHLLLIFNDLNGKMIEIDFQGFLRKDHYLNDQIAHFKEQYDEKVTKIDWNERECYIKICFE
ncbi:sporulation initiation phosphotransferase B [Bacillus shivajii]|uniref:Spo0B C-terminal domain-containing protein n=1 Tax=Bacillus shivajii TaxID=1983719 RepID=UPI001CF96098|nr:Spo0B C-terminal domain-containing protein [Bacillus shivajii]UCZ54339.1 sporulation initiation phosphotransferase B [Bacillus shivajii]